MNNKLEWIRNEKLLTAVKELFYSFCGVIGMLINTNYVFSSCSSCALLFIFVTETKIAQLITLFIRVSKFSVNYVMIRFRAFHVLDYTLSLLSLYLLPTVQMHDFDVSYPKFCTHFLIPLTNYTANQWCFLVLSISPILRYLMCSGNFVSFKVNTTNCLLYFYYGQRTKISNF
jgi:hypothetical protein